jgi:hypothetical protein
MMRGARAQITLAGPLETMVRPSVGKPVAVLGNWKLFLAALADCLGRRSDTVADDFVNRFTGRAALPRDLRVRRTRFHHAVDQLDKAVTDAALVHSSG